MTRAMRTRPAAILVLQWLLWWRLALADNSSLPQLTINRHREGDMYSPKGSSCPLNSCLGGGETVSGQDDPCQCQCKPDLPVFRDDLLLCVNDIQGKVGNFKGRTTLSTPNLDSNPNIPATGEPEEIRLTYIPCAYQRGS
uniref:Shavenoid isoform B-like N-terminal domain-containing protein n=1 Tax=Timema cristinae TaxID=61476 RepID=A0A7R9CFV4_TIMCR|nr:unnamed protein product [Timema cristinae]